MLDVAEQPLPVVPVTEYVVVTDGLTVTLAETAPVFHKKLDAPDTVSVVEAPAQIEEDKAEILIEGAEFTTIVFDSVAVQPLLLVPVTEYVVVTDGLTVIDDDVAPLLQTYDDAPLAVSVVDAPEQIVDDETLTLMLGMAFTVMTEEALPEHPLELVPVTE